MNNATWSAIAIAVAVAAATAAQRLSTGPGPFTVEAQKLDQQRTRLEFDDQYRPCLGTSALFNIDPYRSVPFIAETEASPFKDETVLRAAVEDLRAYIERRRSFVETCKAAMAAGQWTEQARSQALQAYAEKKRAAEEGWKRARNGAPAT